MKYYPFSKVEIKQGDVLYSPIGRSTYFVGHTVIIGADMLVTESIPGKPSGHKLSVEQFWRRHHPGNKITLLRAENGAQTAAKWATANVEKVKDYWVANTSIHNIEKNYCSKFIVQAYYFGSELKLTKFLNRFISPQYLNYLSKLKRVAIFQVH